MTKRILVIEDQADTAIPCSHIGTGAFYVCVNWSLPRLVRALRLLLLAAIAESSARIRLATTGYNSAVNKLLHTPAGRARVQYGVRIA